MKASAIRAVQRIDELGAISETDDGLLRQFLSQANLRAAEKILEWMSLLGMHCEHQADGTIRGILSGSNPTAKPLLLGSHIDTVAHAGKYDGALGVIAALAALEDLLESGCTLPFPVHVLGFSDEEGVRFQATYLGSRAVVAGLDESLLSCRDAAGDALRDVLERDGWHDGAAHFRYAPGDVLGYVELHIEQGRVLEEAKLPIGVVSGIAGQSRISITLKGQADHAGTTPMPLRRDAMVGAAACVLAAESLAHAHSPLVATVGQISLSPNVSNSVPESVKFSLDFRHPDDEQRVELLDLLSHQFHQIAQQRDLEIHWQVVQESGAVACDDFLIEKISRAAKKVTGRCLTLASGAGHDGVMMQQIGPIGMIFVRCLKGLSHHPDEYCAPEDIAAGIDVLVEFLNSFHEA